MDSVTARRRLHVHAAHVDPSVWESLVCPFEEDGIRASSSEECSIESMVGFDESVDETSGSNNEFEDMFVEYENVAGSNNVPAIVAPLMKKSIGVLPLRHFFDGEYRATKDALREFIDESDDLQYVEDLTMDEMRALTSDRVRLVAKSGLVQLEDLRDNPGAFFSAVEILATFDTSLMTKLAVQFSLWGGTVMNLGTQRHAHMIPLINNYKLPGCFGMTELGHGSNVQGIETTAVYDFDTQEFIINSPSYMSTKYWIGNAARDALKCTVFARLNFKGEDKGVHAFVVDLRDDQGNLLDGIVVFDCGHKLGLNGVDNGAIQFRNVRIPRTNMLNRFSDVTEKNEYILHVENKSRHFGATVAELSGGRVMIGAGAVSIAKTALTIAIRYGFARKQFGPVAGREVPIMAYPTHRVRLMPLLAGTVLHDSMIKFVARSFGERNDVTIPFVHSLTAFFKAVAGWQMNRALQVCRECCGGQGFRSKNRIAPFKSDTDIFLTFEGDNTVLMQQTTRYLISCYTAMSKKKSFSGVLAYMNNKVGAPKDGKWSCPKFQAALLESRERILLEDLLKRLANAKKQGLSEYDAWQSNLNWVNRVAFAHADRLVHEVFRADVKSRAPGSLVEVLDLCRTLDFVSRLRENLGFFLVNNLISADAARTLDEEVESLCSELTPYSLDIVSAFAIPSKCLPREDLCEM